MDGGGPHCIGDHCFAPQADKRVNGRHLQLPGEAGHGAVRAAAGAAAAVGQPPAGVGSRGLLPGAASSPSDGVRPEQTPPLLPFCLCCQRPSHLVVRRSIVQRRPAIHALDRQVAIELLHQPPYQLNVACRQNKSRVCMPSARTASHLTPQSQLLAGHACSPPHTHTGAPSLACSPT